ncbi:hypothetical protein [Lactococcus lactis]|uniref:Uncharacterized protein n=1 Tax=Lactococcus lactis TaxID=1358 RepID=A0AAW5TRA8_9LACT|nr:hypothetical protein [Lactococcus lactis]MCW2281378.1 hypothetical protein [Lactococcus lactis]
MNSKDTLVINGQKQEEPTYQELKEQVMLMTREITGLEATIKSYQNHLAEVISENAIENFKRTIRKEAE